MTPEQFARLISLAIEAGLEGDTPGPTPGPSKDENDATVTRRSMGRCRESGRGPDLDGGVSPTPRRRTCVT